MVLATAFDSTLGLLIAPRNMLFPSSPSPTLLEGLKPGEDEPSIHALRACNKRLPIPSPAILLIIGRIIHNQLPSEHRSARSFCSPSHQIYWTRGSIVAFALMPTEEHRALNILGVWHNTQSEHSQRQVICLQFGLC